MRVVTRWSAVVLISLGGASAAQGDSTFYIERGAVWKFFRGVSEASSPDPAAWRATSFDDSTWERGPAPFGYGDPPYGTDLSRSAPAMQNGYSSLFLRRSFVLSDAAAVVALQANVNYDDGFIAWLNGVEVLRVGVNGNRGDPVAFDGVASTNREPGRYENLEILEPRSLLVTGVNVLAVQAFNSLKSNNDFKLDLELFDPFGPDLQPPSTAFLVPAPGSRIRRLSRVEVTFSEIVSGVDAGDLLVNGSPARQVTGEAEGPYVFTLAAPAAGRVEVSWAAGHGIADLSTRPNSFPGGIWTYTLDPTSPPANLVISELLAQAGGGLKDEDNQEVDWIEIQNRGAEAVNLSGWSLSDDPDNPGQWTFPDVALPPGGLVVVFASGKDRRPSGGGTLHTNFQLNAAGDYLGLFTPESPRESMSEMSPRFPAQRLGVSYGFDAAGTPGYFSPPTPGAPNGEAAPFRGFAGDPTFRPGRGFYTDPIDVEISSRTPGASIYYTLDGSEPTVEKGTLLAGRLQVAGDPRRGAVTVRAMAVRDGYLLSDSVTATYIFVEHVLTQPPNPAGFPTRWGPAPAVDYEMDRDIVTSPLYRESIAAALQAIPSISVVAAIDDIFGTRGIYSNPETQGAGWERPASAELILPDGKQGPDGKRGFQINCGVQIQGGASRLPEKSPKHALRLLFKGDYGPTRLRYPLFPGSPVDSFDVVILRAGFNNSWVHWNGGQRSRAQYIHDQWARDTQLAMGGLAGHGIYVHVYLNGLYWGLYNAVERPNADFAASHMGGEKEDWDALNAAVPINGNLQAWSRLMSLSNTNLAGLAQYGALQEYLDAPAFADYMLLNFYGANMDWPNHNWYCVRRRETGARWLFVSWDAERILEGVSDTRISVADANSPGFIQSRLVSSPEYRLLFADRVHRALFSGGVLTPEEATKRWMARADTIEAAVVAESARWGDYRRDVHQWQDPPYELYARHSHWLIEQKRLVEQYFPQRTKTLLAQLRQARLYPTVEAPVLSQQGGLIQPGFALSMALPEGAAGTILFTTSGADPRIYGTGAVSPEAIEYQAPVAIADLTVVKARTLSGANWSALAEATFRLSASPGDVRISEIMYHPEGGSGLEFIELTNAGGGTADLSGMRLADGIEMNLSPRTFLRRGTFLVLAADPTAFAAAYPGVAVGGRFSGGLDNGGERITLTTAAGETLLSVDFDDEGLWPIGADGLGYSLILVDPDGDPADPENWRASAAAGGSPGAADPAPRHGGVVVSEILPRSAPPFEGAIELQNLTGRDISIGGWYLSDERADEDSLRKFRIPSGSVIPAGGYAVFYESQFNADPSSPASFALSPEGGAVFLSSAGRDRQLSGAIVSAEYRAAEPGVSYGRHETGYGVDFVPLVSPTFGVERPATPEEFRSGKGAPNSRPRLGPVAINEVHYHPEDDGEEFIELHGPTGAAVPLHDAALGRGWRLAGPLNEDGTDEFEFAAGAAIPARGYALVVGIEPQVFRSRHPLPPDVPVFGPFGGALDNGGERLRLSRPARIDGGEVSFVLIDHVRYDDLDPWPVEADGSGPSLERVLASSYGNDPLNWEASKSAGGTPGEPNSASPPAGNSPPIATFTASALSGPAPLTVTLDGSASSDAEGAIAAYEWDFGDGETAADAKVTHVFTRPGVYGITLRVADGQGAWAAVQTAVTAKEDVIGGGQVPGDLTQDGRHTISDAIAMLLHLFSGQAGTLPCDGTLITEGGNRALADVNGDATVNLTDPVHLLHFLFRGGPRPADGIDCVRIAGCRDACVP